MQQFCGKIIKHCQQKFQIPKICSGIPKVHELAFVVKNLDNGAMILQQVPMNEI